MRARTRSTYHVGPRALDGKPTRLASIWSVPVGGRPKLLVRFDDPSHTSTRADFATDDTRLYFALEDRQSDIWGADVRRR